MSKTFRFPDRPTLSDDPFKTPREAIAAINAAGTVLVMFKITEDDVITTRIVKKDLVGTLKRMPEDARIEVMPLAHDPNTIIVGA